MKKGWLFIVSILLVFSMLLQSGCASIKGDNAQDTTTPNSAEETSVEQETYIDLSDENSPVWSISSEEDDIVVTASSNGNGQANDAIIAFDGKESNYTLQPYGVGGTHDAYSCKNCKYEEKNGATALHFCDHSDSHTGILVELKTPIPFSLVSGLQMTFMTSDEITQESQIRILKKDEHNTSAIINHSGCPSLSGATEKWKTVDFNMDETHLRSLADDDGYIRAFKFYFRDKDSTDIYIKSFTFTVSIKQLCTVPAIDENTFSGNDALTAIANKIAGILTTENIGAEVELRQISYTAPTAKKHGSITYKTIIIPENGSKISLNSRTTTLKKLEQTWLPLNNEEFGTLRDAKEQWKTGFDRSGILCLEDNVLKADDQLVSVEYAVIAKDADVVDENTQWFAPQLLELNSEGIEKLYINAYLDYGSKLIEGTDYRFVVRGVTENQNYILHLDIPFNYSPISAEVIESLDKAANAVSDWEELFALDHIDNVENFVKERIEEAINDENITVEVTMTANGVNSGRYTFTISYNGNIVSSRFPSYSFDGVAKSNFFDYTGVYFTSVNYQIHYDLLPQTAISLLSPYDGMENVRIASDETVRFWNTDTDVLVTSLYNYKGGEVCDPVPIRLEWNDDTNGTYTVKISEYRDLDDAWVFTTSDHFYDVYNLKAGTRYYWKVENGETASRTYTFVTEAGYPRYILSDNISNFRDIGGHQTTDGHTVKQGLAFRLSNFDSASAADKQFILNYLGIKSELDLRGEITKSPLGDTVTPYPISIKWYSGIFAEGESEPLRRAIAVFAKEENYPIGYHCAIGRDRTGTITILLLGLLGVDEDTILKDYVISKNSVTGNNDGLAAASFYDNYKSLINGLNTYGKRNDTFQNKVENYLLSIGVTAEEIASIKNIFLEK